MVPWYTGGATWYHATWYQSKWNQYQSKHKKYGRDVELKLLRYCADFGQGIWAFTTKDKPSTLPFCMYNEQYDCSAKTSEELFDVFNVFLNNSGGKHKKYELDEQFEERGVDTYVNKQERSKSGSYIYAVKQSPTNLFIGFLQRSKPVPTATRSVSGEIHRPSADENFKFSKCGKGTVKLKDILCDAFITLPSIAINHDPITISKIDYCKILPSVRQDYDLFKDKLEVPEIDEFAYTNCDEQSTQDSDEDHTCTDQQMQINIALGTRIRSRRAAPKFDDFIA